MLNPASYIKKKWGASQQLDDIQVNSANPREVPKGKKKQLKNLKRHELISRSKSPDPPERP